ncbi:PleD family two-component system response regulator [Nitrosopumilus sp.]|uniref:PleD family two-component system response regulator n=1 Tax=Nitrosopumilus sp. TaxID=2024843 RepID=UPI0034A021C9
MAKIMLIDSSHESRLELKSFLLTHNHDIVYETHDGFEAIERYFLIKPEIIFLDLMMNNYDGLEILKKIKQKDPSSKIIILTSNDKMNILEECIKFGSLVFISKPLNFEDILSTISFVNEINLLQSS